MKEVTLSSWEEFEAEISSIFQWSGSGVRHLNLMCLIRFAEDMQMEIGDLIPH
jgi:hypothetical protein